MAKKNNKKPSKKNIRGTLPTFTKKIILEIINIYANSSVGIAQILKEGIEQGKTYPVRSTFYKWLDDHKELSDTYAQAQALHEKFIAYEALEVADKKSDDYVENHKGQMVFDKENVHRSKLRVETRFRLLEYLNGMRNRDKDNDKTSASTVINFYPSSQKPKED